MALTMHAMSVPIFVKTLGNLALILEKAGAHAQARGFEPAVLLHARLYPDMFPVIRQVQIGCDFAKGSVARLCGEEPPKFDDVETTFDELRARIARTVSFIEGYSVDRFAGAETRTVEIKMRDGTHHWSGQVYLTQMVLPNFFFHVTTAYDILRHNGVDIGKRDFIGKLD